VVLQCFLCCVGSVGLRLVVLQPSLWKWARVGIEKSTIALLFSPKTPKSKAKELEYEIIARERYQQPQSRKKLKRARTWTVYQYRLPCILTACDIWLTLVLRKSPLTQQAPCIHPSPHSPHLLPRAHRPQPCLTFTPSSSSSSSPSAPPPLRQPPHHHHPCSSLTPSSSYFATYSDPASQYECVQAYPP